MLDLAGYKGEFDCHFAMVVFLFGTLCLNMGVVVSEPGVQAPSKNFDLLKMLAKSLNILAISPKIRTKMAPNLV